MLCHPGRQQTAAAVGDIGERTAMYQGRNTFQALHQVGVDGVAQQGQNRAADLQLLHKNRLAAIAESDQGVFESVAKIVQPGCQAEHRHDFRSSGDVEAPFPRNPLELAAQPQDDMPQAAVIHIEDSPPEYPAGIDVQLVALIDMIVNHCRDQVVGAGDSVEVAGEMQVDPVGRQDLAIAAAGGAPFHPQAGTEGRFAQRQADRFAQLGKRLPESNCRGGFAFPGGSRCGR